MLQRYIYPMQFLKNTIKYQISISAEKLFQKKGFIGTSMREIAIDSNVGLGNIYNYFKSKDDIFRAIVQPSVTNFMQMYKKHHSKKGMKIMLMYSETYFENIVNDHLELIIANKNSYKLLFFKSQGSSFERFKDEFTNYATKQSKQYMIDMKHTHPQLSVDISDFFIHTSILGMFNLFEGLLVRKITRKEIKPIIQEYMRFNLAGWKELTRM